jgi:5-methyltetrahydrofolate--homocysteine methyltransferase
VETTVSSKTKTVIIGPDRPFTIIGERINPTGRKKLAEEMAAGDFGRVEADTLAQVQAGAHMLDVNAGIPLVDEPALLAQTIQIVQSLTDVPLCIDSSVVAALERGLEVYEGKALVNSVTGEDERLEAVLPLVKKHGAAVIGISNDETGISEDPAERFKIATKIVHRAMDYGIPKEDVLIDPLVLPAGAIRGAGRQVFEIIRLIRDELDINTVCGASNISFGLPNRNTLNAHFLSMAIAAGLTSAITNPIDSEIMNAIMAADLLMGHDSHCASWIARNRELMTNGEGSASSDRQRRRGRRQARRRSRSV